MSGFESARSRLPIRLDSGEVEAVEVHDLVPRGDEVTDELLLRVIRRVDLRQGAQLRVRTEDEVDRGGRPPDVARGAVAPFVLVLRRHGRGPLRAHVEEVHEEVVGQGPGPVGEDTAWRAAVVHVEGTEATDE